jgi:Family of unknown function (DUF6787)
MNKPAAERRPNFYVRLKQRWGVTDWGLVVIVIAFALAGSTVVVIGRPIVNYILPDDVPRWLWWTVKIVLIVPLYEMILVSYGTLLGQGRFFRDKQRRLLRLLARPFRRTA